MESYKFTNIVRVIFVLTILVSLLSGIALADVIFEPEDDFYKTHSNECQYVNRDYYANDISGYLELFSKPNGKSLGFADNGKIFHVQFSYINNNELWGVVEYSVSGDKIIPREDGEFKTGWIKISSAVPKYDYISFQDEHLQEFKPYIGDYSELSGLKNIVIWSFPHSGENYGTLEDIDDNFVIDSVYTDTEGLVWAYEGYYYGNKNFWICLSDPMNTDIAEMDIDTPDIITPQPGTVPQSSTEDLTTVIIIGVAAVVLFSAVLIAALNIHKAKSTK